MPYQRVSNSCLPHHFFKSSASSICWQVICSLYAILPKVWTCTLPENKLISTLTTIWETKIWPMMRTSSLPTCQEHERGYIIGRDRFSWHVKLCHCTLRDSGRAQHNYCKLWKRLACSSQTRDALYVGGRCLSPEMALATTILNSWTRFRFIWSVVRESTEHKHTLLRTICTLNSNKKDYFQNWAGTLRCCRISYRERNDLLNM